MLRQNCARETRQEASNAKNRPVRRPFHQVKHSGKFLASPTLLTSSTDTNNLTNSKHQRYHNKPHRCQQCDRRFVTITHLTRHVNDVHERQEHYCPVGGCEYSLAAGNGKSFAREWNLTRHLRNMH
ncbi:hypothetical protein BKA64DRAFT_32723 [Cadophora sp. MPI-SDFR-AT-0126]|nr:hypothetical protein BKA64DRAFT_32723 [Leotiomycetes sp. MPI-SDFR-AT-0126]